MKRRPVRSQFLAGFPKFLIGRHHTMEQEAWWYADEGGIDVLCSTQDGHCTAVRLTWGQLRKAMAAKARVR